LNWWGLRCGRRCSGTEGNLAAVAADAVLLE
jgi:hypothetical protein